jgi:Tfp pilus assembly protein PilN
MATTLVTDPRRPSPRPNLGGELRFVSIHANLLPDEVVASRHADATRRRVLVGIAAVVAMLVAGYGYSWLQTKSANSTLSTLKRQQSALMNQQQQFGPLVAAQAQVQAIDGKLQTLMIGDLSWTQLLERVRAVAPSGVTLTQVNGSITVGTAPNGTAADTQTVGSQPLNESGQAQVGSLTIAGVAPSKQDVAAYSDALARVHGLASPYITSVTAATAGNSPTFSLTVLLTEPVLGGRFANPTSPTSGSPSTPGGK